MFFATLRIALREIRANLMRSILTTLGIIIGVGAVIIVSSLGDGARRQMENDLASLGNNLIVVRAGVPGRGGPGRQASRFDDGDVAAIREQVPYVQLTSPGVSTGVVAVAGNENHSTTISGVERDYFAIRNLEVAEGRIFNDAEERSARPVCVIGQTVREELFGVLNPLGASIRLTANSSVTCTVIGLLTEKGASTMGTDQDDLIIAPLGMVQRRLTGQREISAIYMSAVSEDANQLAIDGVTELLRERRRIREGEDNDFWVQDLKEIQEQVSQVTGVMTLFVAAIAAISLLVGGIGVMNIMLVSVTERTREIGIRLAVGAQQMDVLVQFLVEAIMLSIMGGIIGIGVGIGLTYVASAALSFPFVVNQTAVGISFFFSAFIGVAFGFFPAFRAARLDPIEALRYE